MTVRVNKKKNPDPVTTFAALASGMASALTVHQMLKPKRKPAARRGTTKAKPVKRQANPKAKPPKGDLYVLTIGSGDDLMSVHLHDGNKDGFSKRFKTMAAAKAFATRNKVKLIDNPKLKVNVGGYVDASGVFHPIRSSEDYSPALAGERGTPKRKMARTVKSRFKKATTKKQSHIKHRVTPTKVNSAKSYAKGSTDVRPLTQSDREQLKAICAVAVKRADRSGKQAGIKVFESHIGGGHATFNRAVKSALAKFRRTYKAPRKNPKSTARRRTFEMFQGRKVTTARPMMVSNHAPANLDALGDLVELKISGGPSLKFNGKGTKLCAAHGKLWIAGKRFAKPNPSARANELNPIGEIDHVVYGTHKPHHGDHDYTHYIHKLGEESGKRPILCVDREGYPVIRGGNYKIEARGIVD